MSNYEEDHSDDNGIVLGVLSSYYSLNTEDVINTNQLPSAETSARQYAGGKWHQIFRVDVIVVTTTIAIMIGMLQLPIIYFYIPVVSEWWKWPLLTS